MGDFNGDLNDDVIVSSVTDGATYFIQSNGDGTFQPKVLAAPVAGPLMVADIDGDGKLDFAVAAAGGITYVLGNGNGTFAAPVAKWAWGRSLALGDVNGIGGLDAVMFDYSTGQVATFIKGAGTAYTYLGSRSPPTQLVTVLLPDADGDGKPDVAMLGSSLLGVALNAGDGSDRARANYGSGYLPTAALVVDLNADGRDDLVIASQTEKSFRVLVSRCP